MCDIVLVADGAELHAHRTVLAACSPYFLAMFSHFDESTKERVPLQCVDAQALQLLIDYVYTCQINVTEQNVQV